MKDFGIVDFYFIHSFMVNGVGQKHVFACVNWYVPTMIGPFVNLNPLCVTSKTHLFPGGASRFLPIQRIATKCAFTVTECAFTVTECAEGQGNYVVSPLLLGQFRLCSGL
jgi:hypothetical protein